MKLIGVVLIVSGLLGLLYGGLTYTNRHKVIDAGPIQVTRDETNRVPIPPVAGGLLLGAGVVLVLRSDK